ncbi:unnamed protein product [Polarella glacialis]|uniref:Uncharacterized protein n=1 Tax=Polarella glacialis TaxID=89957 RepID=A0A813HQH0_POLGL|nr:unnamed protein product [Polarella glacialis]
MDQPDEAQTAEVWSPLKGVLGPGLLKRLVPGRQVIEDPILLNPLPDRESGHKVLAPYIFKVSVSLTNDHVVHLSNSEKHAQSSLTEALDHMVDVVRKSLREEKERGLTSRKKEKRNMMPDTDEDGEDEEAIAARMTEDLDLEKDEATAKMYAKVEGSE